MHFLQVPNSDKTVGSCVKCCEQVKVSVVRFFRTTASDYRIFSMPGGQTGGHKSGQKNGQKTIQKKRPDFSRRFF